MAIRRLLENFEEKKMSGGIDIWLEEFFKFVEVVVNEQELGNFENL